MERAKRTVIAALYAAGTAAVVLLLLLTAIGSRQVLFPDAMLPMELRELASAWLAIGFLPMVLVSVQFYKIVWRKAVFLPAGACLLALMFWVGVWTVGMVRSPAMFSGGDIVFPAAEDLEAVHLTGSNLDFTVRDNTFIVQLLQCLSKAKTPEKPAFRMFPARAGEWSGSTLPSGRAEPAPYSSTGTVICWWSSHTTGFTGWTTTLSRG